MKKCANRFLTVLCSLVLCVGLLQSPIASAFSDPLANTAWDLGASVCEFWDDGTVYYYPTGGGGDEAYGTYWMDHDGTGEMDLNGEISFLEFQDGKLFIDGMKTWETSLSGDVPGGGGLIDDGREPAEWAADDVERAIFKGLVPDYLQMDYNQPITRAEFCALVVNVYEDTMGHAIRDRIYFYDTDDANVEKAAALSIVNGVGGGNFNPYGELTREQAATMLSRLAYSMGWTLTSSPSDFYDNYAISFWAMEAVDEMQCTGIMGGVGNNMFNPQGLYTREQSIVTIMRLISL